MLFLVGVLLCLNMKKIKYIIILPMVMSIVGCAGTMRLPSVTIGSKANKDAYVGMSCSKKGLGVTVPLVNVEIPAPSLSKVKD